jgi:hypothetical protein
MIAGARKIKGRIGPTRRATVTAWPMMTAPHCAIVSLRRGFHIFSEFRKPPSGSMLYRSSLFSRCGMRGAYSCSSTYG